MLYQLFRKYAKLKRVLLIMLIPLRINMEVLMGLLKNLLRGISNVLPQLAGLVK
jgi:hypothetical protein